MVVKLPKRTLYLATQNSHKIDEIRALIGEQWEVKTVAELDPDLSWEETGETFEDNAKIKAIELSERTRECILAEDSGLCVPYLNGEPGVYSNRYAGEAGDHVANIAKLLKALTPAPASARAAYFHCCLVYINEQGEMHTFEGDCHGTIALETRGTQGFGYDPVFIPEGSSKTMAELSTEEKNRISHRKRALEKWGESLR